MSAMGALKDMVEALIRTFTDALHAKDTEQDEKLADLESRVAALESAARPADKTVRAGTAGASAKASPAK